jgi:hypothetical protein
MGLTAKFLCRFLCVIVFCYLLSARQCHDQVTEFSRIATKTHMQIYG